MAAAGVVSGAAVTAIPQQVEPPTIGVDVANAAAVTSLQGLGIAVTVLDSLVGLHVDATISLPFEESRGPRQCQGLGSGWHDIREVAAK